MKAIYVVKFQLNYVTYFKVGSCGDVLSEMCESNKKPKTINKLVRQRLSTLQIGNPFVLILEKRFNTNKNVKRIEKLIHNKLKSHRKVDYLRGEWFIANTLYFKIITDYIHELIHNY